MCIIIPSKLALYIWFKHCPEISDTDSKRGATISEAGGALVFKTLAYPEGFARLGWHSVTQTRFEMELGSHISNALGAFLLPETDYTKQLQLDSNMGVGPSTPQNKQRGAKGAEMVSVDFFSTVPEEVLAQIATRLDSTSDLCALASVAKRWHTVVEVKNFKFLKFSYIEIAFLYTSHSFNVDNMSDAGMFRSLALSFPTSILYRCPVSSSVPSCWVGEFLEEAVSISFYGASRSVSLGKALSFWNSGC